MMAVGIAAPGLVVPPAPRMPRILAAVFAVVALHSAILAFRPGVSGSAFAAVAPAVTVRLVPSHATAPAPARPEVASPPQEPPALAQAVPTQKSEIQKAESVRPPSPVAPPHAANLPQPQPATGATAVSASDPASNAPRPLAAAPDYALGARLDPGPRPIGEIEPDYPDPVYLRSGVVVLRLLIGDTGHVDDVAVVSASPRGVFDQAAVEAFAKARFSPGMAGGVPVKSQITVEVEFAPINRGARISGRTY